MYGREADFQAPHNQQEEREAVDSSRAWKFSLVPKLINNQSPRDPRFRQCTAVYGLSCHGTSPQKMLLLDVP